MLSKSVPDVPPLVAKIFHMIDDRYIKRDMDLSDEVISKSLYVTILEQVSPDHPYYLCASLRLGFLHLHTKEYNKALAQFQQVFCIQQKDRDIKSITELYLALILGLLFRVNFDYRESLYCMRIVESSGILPKRRMESLESAVWFWKAELYQLLELLSWSETCYQKCLFVINNGATHHHPFIHIAQVYVNLSEIAVGMGQNDLCVQYYMNAYQEYETTTRKTFIKTSPFTKNYQQACICVRLANICYCNEEFETALEYYKKAERKFQLARVKEKKKESTTQPETSFLNVLHVRLSITYCRVGDFENASRYVKPDITPILQIQDSNIDYGQELEIRRQQRQRKALEKRSYAPNVIYQDNPICHLCLALIAMNRGDVNGFLQNVQNAIVDRSDKSENVLPLLMYQRIVTLLIINESYDVAQLVMAKCMLHYEEYALGWYLLFLLSVKNEDQKYITGSHRKFIELKTNHPSMVHFWPALIMRSKL
ncbi:NprA [Acrasis kona]|uniref:NprA n=1 Tax=Acrasis kona TaxID=1008807 RepID=A0AAW2ZE37_9EUKA